MHITHKLFIQCTCEQNIHDIYITGIKSTYQGKRHRLKKKDNAARIQAKILPGLPNQNNCYM